MLNLTIIKLNLITKQEESIIKECLNACINDFDDFESPTLFGMELEQMQEIADQWPLNKSQPDTYLAVYRALLYLLYYPHGYWDSLAWKQYISVSVADVRDIFDKLTGEEKPLTIYDIESLMQYLDQGNPVEYLFFWNQKNKNGGITTDCLSQWYPAFFAIDKVVYCNAEQYMMAEKARLFGNQEMLARILQSESSREAKMLGRQIKNFDQKIWEHHRFDIVLKGNCAKFGQNYKLGQFLLGTKNKILVEASPVDAIWGIGLAENDTDACNPQKWPGLNLLGFVLMKVRNHLYYRNL